MADTRVRDALTWAAQAWRANTDQPVDAETLAAVWADLLQAPAARIELRGNTSSTEAFPQELSDRVSVRTYGVHVLDLTGGFDTVWAQRFKSVKRTSIRRAERAGP